jgi:cytochrome c nitrite reductase small subunit
MDYQYDAWLKTGLHRSIKCVDCHLPNNNPVNHFVWKGIDGMKDVIYFYGRLYGDDIRASSHAVGVINDNCIRCHGEMVSRMSTGDGITCWSCHRRVNHRVLLSGMDR